MEPTLLRGNFSLACVLKRHSVVNRSADVVDSAVTITSVSRALAEQGQAGADQQHAS